MRTKLQIVDVLKSNGLQAVDQRRLEQVRMSLLKRALARLAAESKIRALDFASA